MNPEGHSTSFLLGAQQGGGEGRPETEEHIKGPESLLKPQLEAAAGKEGLHLPTQCPVGSGPGRVGLALQARRRSAAQAQHPAGLHMLGHPHTCPFTGGTLPHTVVTPESPGAAGLSSGPCRAQPRLVQWAIEHHIRQDGDFQLLFRPAVLFGEFELWREQAQSQSAHVSRIHGLPPRLPRVAGTLTQACPWCWDKTGHWLPGFNLKC